MLRTVDVSRRFGRTVALEAVNFATAAGEIHAVLGENGAGKTTLMSIIAGHLRADRGEVLLEGHGLRPGSASAAIAAGIALVHQSPLLFERFSTAENLAVGALADRRRPRDTVSKAFALAERLNFPLADRVSGSVEGFSMSARVRLEILRALSLEPKVLILDEPTALLSPGELAGFLDLLRALRSNGRSVILITHKLAEAMAVADRITVLRAGRVVASCRPAETSEAALGAAMVGQVVPPAIIAARAASSSASLLRIDDLRLALPGRPALQGISLRLNGGEIFGVAGVDGNGQTELVEVLAGHHYPTAGRIELAGVSPPGDGEIAVIPQNRDQDALILDMELWENLLLAGRLRRTLSRAGFQRRRRALDLCADLLGRFQIRAPGPRLKAAALSGGHRQRLTIARALATSPKILVAHDITRGLDVSATVAVHRLLIDFAAQGGGVLLFSTDLDEIVALCHRVAVIARGRLVEVAPGDRYPERLGLLMAGAGS